MRVASGGVATDGAVDYGKESVSREDSAAQTSAVGATLPTGLAGATFAILRRIAGESRVGDGDRTRTVEHCPAQSRATTTTTTVPAIIINRLVGDTAKATATATVPVNTALGTIALIVPAAAAAAAATTEPARTALATIAVIVPAAAAATATATAEPANATNSPIERQGPASAASAAIRSAARKATRAGG